MSTEAWFAQSLLFRDPWNRPAWEQTGPGYAPKASSTTSSSSSYGGSTPSYSSTRYTPVSTPASSLSRVTPTRSTMVASVGTQTEPWGSDTNSSVSSPDIPKSVRESSETDEASSSGRTTPRPSDTGVSPLDSPSPIQPSMLAKSLENLRIECNRSSSNLRSPPSIPPTVSSLSEKDASVSRQTVSPISLDGDVMRFRNLQGLDVAAWSMGVRG